jgi:hypothetical protein
MSIKVSLDLREIYELLCDDCRRKLRELVARKVGEQVSSQLFEGR